MVGGTTSGYSLMGRRHMAMKPTMKMRAESTPAKIGRRMKNWEKFMIVSGLVLNGVELSEQNSERGQPHGLQGVAIGFVCRGSRRWRHRALPAPGGWTPAH